MFTEHLQLYREKKKYDDENLESGRCGPNGTFTVSEVAICWSSCDTHGFCLTEAVHFKTSRDV